MCEEQQAAASDGSASSESRKRGRPKGSKTQQLEHVIDIPAACPKCGCTEHRVLATPKQREITGVMIQQAYNRVTWRRCQCRKCEQVYMQRSYRLI